MPLILSSNFSKSLQKNPTTKKELLHGDGIDFDINSREALDEIFFNDNKEFIKNELVNCIKLILINNNKKSI